LSNISHLALIECWTNQSPPYLHVCYILDLESCDATTVDVIKVLSYLEYEIFISETPSAIMLYPFV